MSGDKEFLDRLKSLMYPSENDKKFEERIGVAPGTMKMIKKGGALDDALAEALSKGTGVAKSWLLEGKGNKWRSDETLQYKE